MRFLLLIIATTSLFAQKEYDIDDIYFSAPKQVYIKKFSDEIVDGKIFAKIGNNKAFLGKIDKGLRQGLFTTWYSSGIKKSETNFVDNLKNGKQKNYDEEGVLESVTIFKDDKEHGDYIAYFPSGKIETKIPMLNGKVSGDMLSYYENGNVKSRVVDLNLKTGQRAMDETFFENGMKESIKKFNINGSTYYKKSWDEFGKLTEFTNLDETTLDGVSMYYLNGIKKRVYELKGGENSGMDTLFSKEGRIISTTSWMLGEKHGIETFYSAEGQKTLEKKYVFNVVLWEKSLEVAESFNKDIKLYNKLKDDGFNKYEFFLRGAKDKIYSSAQITDTLKTIKKTKGYYIFPLIRKEKEIEGTVNAYRKDFVLVINDSDEPLGYVLRARIGIPESRDFNKKAREIRFKYELD